MRLINADALQEYFEKVKKESDRLVDVAQIIGVQAVIDNQPTAYDVDKVVDRMEEIREEILSDTAYDNETVNHYLGYTDLMIEFVKSGFERK